MRRSISLVISLSLVTSAAAEDVRGTVYLASERGIWKSVDSGRTWSIVLDRYPADQPRLVAAHPTMPDIVLAAGRDGLFRSVDGGGSWKPVIAVAGSIRTMSFADGPVVYVVADAVWRSRDSGETWDVFAGELQAPVSVAADPENGERLFLLTKTGLFRTDDDGATFGKCQD